MKTYDEAIAEAAAALNNFLAEERRRPVGVATLPQVQAEQKPRRRLTRKAA